MSAAIRNRRVVPSAGSEHPAPHELRRDQAGARAVPLGGAIDRARKSEAACMAVRARADLGGTMTAASLLRADLAMIGNASVDDVSIERHHRYSVPQIPEDPTLDAIELTTTRVRRFVHFPSRATVRDGLRAVPRAQARGRAIRYACGTCAASAYAVSCVSRSRASLALGASRAPRAPRASLALGAPRASRAPRRHSTGVERGSRAQVLRQLLSLCISRRRPRVSERHSTSLQASCRLFDLFCRSQLRQ
jgi:hypothetical protein